VSDGQEEVDQQAEVVREEVVAAEVSGPEGGREAEVAGQAEGVRQEVGCQAEYAEAEVVCEEVLRSEVDAA
jgi:hypothetical protein